MASNTVLMGNLPRGCEICTTIPDILYLPELVFGGLVWILVASTLVVPANPLGWVMFVSVFCFVLTFIWMVVFRLRGTPQQTQLGCCSKELMKTNISHHKPLKHHQIDPIFIT
ncbi:Myelin and lymphocyte protein [Merluccius polli]|uniref:Myelin and lymphocyte protein n=1 Tax=Merluccius polli TaxID=89951 RepID=A0AA47M4A4_MERPO|nr:Myelin and lymphocyte protein [Merluccius polli]